MDQHPIVIYTASYCPYCTRAKTLLTSKGFPFYEIDVTTDQEGRAEMMKKAEGRKTVPQIFVYGKPIGGCDDLHEKMGTGEFQALFKEAAPQP